MLVAAADELEEKVGGAGVVGEVAQFVDQVHVHLAACASTGILASRTPKSWPYGSHRTVAEYPQSGRSVAESRQRRTVTVSALR